MGKTVIRSNRLENFESCYEGGFKDNSLMIMDQNILKIIQERIGYCFSEEYLLVQAFTRSSFSAENYGYEDNERLEFIGDKALDFVVVKKLTDLYGFVSEDVILIGNDTSNFSQDRFAKIRNFNFVFSEGEMTEAKKQVVQTAFLSSAIEKLGFEKYLIMGKGDIKNNVQNEPHVKEDLFEAIIGAVAIDSSWNITELEKVIDKMLNIDYYLQNGVEDTTDYITYVQNWHQREYNREPEYVFLGNGSEEIFQCELSFKGFDVSFEGFGYSKKEAIKLAAKRAYEYLQENQKKSNRIMEIVGDFDFDSAVNKLQMLQDKKIISGLDFIFREGKPTEESNGNPIWYCECVVDGMENFVEYGDPKKIQAKKAAAYTALRILVEGRDKMMELFEEHGKIIEIIEKEEI